MVNVANDAGRRDGDLPSSPSPNHDTRPDPDVSGISLRLIAGLAATAQGSVQASPDRLDASVDSTLPLRQALKRIDGSGASGSTAGTVARTAWPTASCWQMPLPSATSISPRSRGRTR